MNTQRAARRALLLGSLLLLASAAQAETSTQDAIAEYREMFGDDNPAELWQARGEALWREARGPKKASLEACGIGIARELRPWNLTASSFFDGAETCRTIAAGLIGATANDSPSRSLLGSRTRRHVFLRS